jgi:cell division FtsZ-interacting protein ZapD
MVLGGSLLQVLVPLVVSGAFLFRQANNFGASVGLWWTGQSLADVAVYIRDARELRLQLLGGGTGADRPGWHDWENLLGRLGLLEQERIIAAVVGLSGLALMVLALVWGAALLRGQHRSLG